MARAGLINYSARDFSSRGEMDSHIERQDEIFTPEVVKAFNDAGFASEGRYPDLEPRWCFPQWNNF